MPFTFKNLKNEVRSRVYPAKEANNLVIPHDRMMVDALVDVQWIDCWQQDNTKIIPQCATFYNCGITTFDFPRARIISLSVIERKSVTVADNPATSAVVFTTDVTVPGSSWPGYPNTFNNGINNGFAAIDTKPSVKYTFAAPTIINQYSFDVVAGSGIARPSVDIPFLFEGSTNGTVWTTIDNRDVVIAADSARQTITIPFTNSTEYLHYRLSIGGTSVGFQLWGIFIYGLTFTGATAAIGDEDWCSEIFYTQVDQCVIDNYYARSRRAGCCLPMSQFFALPYPLCGGKSRFPVPTDEGVPAGLPLLPFGYHYPQESTDATCGRSLAGVWAIGRGGKISVAPWIQSNETVLVRWDGIKGEWVDADLVERDPKLIKAVMLYLQKETKKVFGDIPGELAAFERDYALAWQDLQHDCREETRLRGCEPSHARGSATSISTLYYNDSPQKYLAQCPGGQIGDARLVTIPADTVSSLKSVSDANQLALAEAKAQAEASLVCTDAPVTYYNTAQTYTATCVQAEGAPMPDGNPSTVTIQANDPRANSTVSQAAADAIALSLATAEALAALVCTFWNSEQTYTAECPEGQVGSDVTKTIAAHTYSSALSQSNADALALTEATNQAIQELVCDAVPTSFPNSPQGGMTAARYTTRPNGTFCLVFISVTIGAGRFYGVNVLAANTAARDYGLALANETADAHAAAHQCGTRAIAL